MKLIQWTLFLDMLGYRDINGAINSEAKAKEFISFMEDNKGGLDFSNRSEVKEQYKKDKSFDLYLYYDVQHAFISDSLIITFTPKEVKSLKNNQLKYMHSANALFIILMRLQAVIFNCFSQKGLFLRGGISTKYCYIKDHFAVGEGLISAYKAESSLAIHPRIVFSPEVLEDKQLKSSITKLSDIMYGGHNIIKLDDDGVHYLDYLGYNLSQIDLNVKMISDHAKRNLPMYLYSLEQSKLFFQRHSEAIEGKLTELESRKAGLNASEIQKLQKVIDKFIWLKNYHNSTLLNHEKFAEYVIN
ncbi:hypothetical protein [Marinospirillum insulare]|uniref:Uncharacterized protein n=1 Tax=Marinospirillum insulare TaxID=217169 RepID=A0ABQ6A3F7_9GAMM|nr:hypothetical protein [Marinospirillum insulare]GLR65107.1 hypothetical protein GCM10007878_25460 [Marinospirillum insulare]